MREANRIEWREKKHAEREDARPMTRFEATIDAALKLPKADLKAELDKAGVTIARVTAADLRALDALRAADQFAAEYGLETGQKHSGRRFANLEIGDLAAVTRSGHVLSLSAQKLDLAEIEKRLAGQKPMPTVVEARAGYEQERADNSALWEQRRAGNQARRQSRDEAITAQRDMRQAVRSFDQATGQAEKFEKPAGLGLAIFGRGIIAALWGLFRFLDLFPVKLTPDQQRRRGQAREEQRAADHIAAAKDRDLREANRLIVSRSNELDRGGRERERERVR